MFSFFPLPVTFSAYSGASSGRWIILTIKVLQKILLNYYQIITLILNNLVYLIMTHLKKMKMKMKMKIFKKIKLDIIREYGSQDHTNNKYMKKLLHKIL